MEAVSLSGMSVSREASVSETLKEDDGRRVSVRDGDRVLVSLVGFLSCRPNTTSDTSQAAVEIDAADFNPSPEAVDPSRFLESYLHLGLGPQSLLGREVFQIALTEMFRAVFRKTNLRRTPGPQGELKRVKTDGGLGSGMYLTEDWSSVSPLPTSMRVCWDE